MAYYRRKNAKRKTGTFYKRKSYARYKKKPSASIVRTIKKVINKSTETKVANFNTGASLLKFNSGINSVADYYQVVPSIVQGPMINERIGDSIRAQSLRIKGYVKLDIITTASVPNVSTVLVRLMVVSLKSKSNYDEVIGSSSPLNGLIRRGGITTTFAGNLNDINAEINSELWTKHYDRKFYLSQDYLNTAVGAADIRNTVKFFNINIKCKDKVLKYDDGTSAGVLPTNFAPVLLVGYSFLNGTAPDTVNTAVGIYYDADLFFKDN